MAVEDVSFTLRKGEILALIGENGAGKSTLSQVLGGALQARQRPDPAGRQGRCPSPPRRGHPGIRMVFQELSLVGSLSIAENIFANRQPVGPSEQHPLAEAPPGNRGVPAALSSWILDPRLLVKRLSMGQQQILEFLKAISTGPKVLILDEPTSSLTESRDPPTCSTTSGALRAEGHVLHLHHPQALRGVPDRRPGDRDAGRPVHRQPGDRSGHREGPGGDDGGPGDLQPVRRCQPSAPRTEMLEGRGLVPQRTSSPISASASARGRSSGFAGLVGRAHGAGPADLRHGPKDGGTVFLERAPAARSGNPQRGDPQGIAYLTEDRKDLGLFLDMPVRDNLVAPSLRRFTSALGFVQMSRIDSFAAQKMQEYFIAAPSALEEGAQALGRQPAEMPGGHSGWARSPRSSSWTSRPAAWTWAPGPKSTQDPRARRSGGRASS